MAIMDLGDVTIHYEEVGQGPLAFVLCQSDHMITGTETGHGRTRYPSSQAEAVAEIDHWKADFGRAIWWEYRGQGESSGAAKYSLPLVASDLARLLDKLEIKSAVVHGLEWGGYMAQQFALDYPEKCAVLILDSTSSEVNAAASEGWYKSAYERQKDPVTYPERPEWSIFACRAVGSTREQPFTPRLKHITSPTLILAGAQDQTRAVPAGVIMSRQLPKCTLKIFDPGGHGLIRERPREVQSLVVQFCREHGVI